MLFKNNINKFYKVSRDIYISELKKILDNKNDNELNIIYDNIKLPKRAIKYSAGYDFFSPIDFELRIGESIVIPTGIKVRMNRDIVLLIFPRSSLGFKYRLQLDNTIGVIDSDYFGSQNEGHIFVKITNDGKSNTVNIKTGTSFCQGVFVKYCLTCDDFVTNERIGGLGSTDDKK